MEFREANWNEMNLLVKKDRMSLELRKQGFLSEDEDCTASHIFPLVDGRVRYLVEKNFVEGLAPGFTAGRSGGAGNYHSSVENVFK